MAISHATHHCGLRDSIPRPSFEAVENEAQVRKMFIEQLSNVVQSFSKSCIAYDTVIVLQQVSHIGDLEDFFLVIIKDLSYEAKRIQLQVFMASQRKSDCLLSLLSDRSILLLITNGAEKSIVIRIGLCIACGFEFDHDLKSLNANDFRGVVSGHPV